MMRNEFTSFQKELYSRDWKAFCGAVPSLVQFQAFNKWKLNKLNEGRKDDSIIFEDYMLFQRDLSAVQWQQQFGRAPNFDDFTQYKRHQGSNTYFNYINIFRCKPSFEQYMRYEEDAIQFDWKSVQCPVPSFDDYVQFLIEKDNVKFDWQDVLGRIPRLEEYMLYADAIKELDEETRAMKQFSFRAILEQGIDTCPSQPPRSDLHKGSPERSRSSRPEHSHGKSTSQSYRSRSPDYGHSRSRDGDKRDRYGSDRSGGYSSSDRSRRRTRSPHSVRHGQRFGSRSPDRTRSVVVIQTRGAG